MEGKIRQQSLHQGLVVGIWGMRWVAQVAVVESRLVAHHRCRVGMRGESLHLHDNYCQQRCLKFYGILIFFFQLNQKLKSLVCTWLRGWVLIKALGPHAGTITPSLRNAARAPLKAGKEGRQQQKEEERNCERKEP